jgi:hypothetical protein
MSSVNWRYSLDGQRVYIPYLLTSVILFSICRNYLWGNDKGMHVGALVPFENKAQAIRVLRAIISVTKSPTYTYVIFIFSKRAIYGDT